MKFPQKIKNRSTVWASSSTSAYITKENKNKVDEIHALPFIATIFAIIKGTT